MKDHHRMRAFIDGEFWYLEGDGLFWQGLEGGKDRRNMVAHSVFGRYPIDFCTGQRDEDGMLVFAGDLWECGWDFPQIVKYNKEEGRFELFGPDSGELSDHTAGYNGIGRIIGNIHQNPELLDTK